MRAIKLFTSSLFMALLTSVTLIFAQSGDAYELVWSSISVSASSSGGDFEMNAIIGEQSVGAISGGDYTVDGDFVLVGVSPAPTVEPTLTPTPGGPTPEPTPKPPSYFSYLPVVAR